MNKISSKQIIGVLLALFGALAVLALIAGAVFYLQPGGNANRIMIAVPDRDNESDLLLVELGKPEEEPVILGRNVLPASVMFLLPQADDHFDILGNFFTGFGGFVPGSDFLMYWYSEDDEIFVNTGPQEGGEPVSLLDTDDPYLSGYVFAESGVVFITESNNEKTYCYIAQPGEEAKRIGRGSNCTISRDGAKLLIEDTSDDATTLTVVDAAGENEVILLDEKKGVGLATISPDGSRTVFIQEDDGSAKLLVMDTANGDVVAESEKYFEIIAFGFAPMGNNLYFIAENEDGELQLFTLDASGEQEIAKGLTVAARFNPSGSHLVYLVGNEDDERTVYVHSMADDTETEIVNGKGLQFTLLTSPERILVRQVDDDELTIYSAGLDGQDILELYSENDVQLTDAYQIQDENRLYLLLDNDDGMTLFVTPLDQESGFEAIEEWDSIVLLNNAPDGSQILIKAREDERDDPALFLLPMVEDGTLIELDDDTEGITNAVFAPDGKQVIYTAQTGSDADEVEVRQVAIDGESKYEALYEESYLVDVQWDMLRPFNFPQFWMELKSGTSYCPGAPALTDKVRAEWEADEEPCYRVSLEADEIYTISVDSSLDTYLSLYDREGVEVASDDDSGPDHNPRIFTSVDTTGGYFIKVSPFSSEAGRFTLEIVQGYGEAALDNPTVLTPDQRTRGAITSSSQLEFEGLNGASYGMVYAFQGQAGERITIDVFGPSIDSNLDPKVSLFSAALDNLGYDDDSGDGYDSKLTLTLPDDGLYFILVESIGSNYGTADNYFFEILLTKN